MHRRLPLLLTAVLTACASAFAQPAEVAVRGAVYFSSDFIRGLIRGHPIDSASAAIEGAYAAEGFLAAHVSADSASGISIVEGRRYVVRTLRVVPDSMAVMLGEDGTAGGELSGGWFTPANVEDAAARLLRQLTARGYPLATARIDDANIDDAAAAVDVTITLEPGERVRIDEIDVRGNTSTKRRLIVAAAGVEPGTIFTDDLALRIRSRLTRLNLFSDVAEPQLYRTDSGRYGILLGVIEGDANSFDGVIGYQPGINGASGFFTGMANVVFRNILGTGRRAALRWQKGTATSSTLELRYGEPLLFGLPLDLDVAYHQVQEETTPALVSYVQRTIGGDFSYGLTDAFTIRLGGAYESTIPQVDTTQPCSHQLLSAGTLESTIGVAYDTRSSTINPLSGLRFTTSYAVGARSVRGPAPCDSGVPASDTRQRVEFDLDTYVPLWRRFVLTNGLHVGSVSAGLLEESDLFRFGGQTTVRGYLEGIFRASRRAWSTLEMRLLLSTSSYAAAFFDAGYFERNADERRGIDRQTGWIYGYGVGAQVETPLGLVRVSYALGRDDTFATGKVFFGLVNLF